MKLLYLTNIPAPYRQKRFNLMQEIFPKLNIDFEVLYMSKSEPNRSWVVPENSFNYKYKIFKGFHPTIGKFYAHFNPTLLLRLLKKDYDIIIIGGLANPTLWLSSFFVHSSAKKVISIETNLKGHTNKKRVAKIVKGFLLNRADAYQVTGEPQKEYIKFFAKKSWNKTFINLPNLIDGDFFSREVARWKTKSFIEVQKKQLGIERDKQIWIIPSRLDSNKIPDSFLNATKVLKNSHILILGDGPNKNHVETFININNLPVTLHPFVQQDELVKFLAIADVFCLASLSDASPLSVIEACASSLPIIVSNTIGNLDDVLIEGENGFSFAPTDTDSIINVFNKVCQKSNSELIEMGKISKSMYERNFNPSHCIYNYGEQIIKFIKG